MTIEELNEKYSQMCDSNDDCDFCKYNRGNCLLYFGYEQGRADAIDEFAELLIKRCWSKIYGDLEYVSDEEIKEVAEQLKEQKNGK